MTPPPLHIARPPAPSAGCRGSLCAAGQKRPRPARWGRGRSLCSCFGGCCQTISGSSGRSDLGGSSLRRCSLAGDLRSSLRRCSLACSLGGSAVLLGHGRGGSSLRLSGSRSSLRGGSGGRRRAAAGSHADSQNQSSNGNSNILEFHMENLLIFENSFAGGPYRQDPSAKRYSSPFLKKIKPFFGKDSICQRDSTLLL